MHLNCELGLLKHYARLTAVSLLSQLPTQARGASANGFSCTLAAQKSHGKLGSLINQSAGAQARRLLLALGWGWKGRESSCEPVW